MEEMRILGVVLAAGSSKRFGANKSAAQLGGKPLVEWAIERARPQVETLLLSANSDIAGMSGIERLADDRPGEGPLTGILVALKKAEERGFTHVMSFACDTPFFPRDTAERLSHALHESHAGYAIARCGPTVHRIFALWPAPCHVRLRKAFASGARSMRSVEDWLTPAWADFTAEGGPDCDPFFNINSPADLAAAERWLKEQAIP
jgi:molybdopterin-guanine dinucleotide biosynthesis protein A